MRYSDKKGPIISLGEDVDKLTIQKSRPLQGLWQSDLSLPEFKILDTYLARIDSRNPDRRVVTFKKCELEKLLGTKEIRPDVLDERLKHLMTTIKIPDEGKKSGFTRISLFERATAEKDDYGMWKVELECTQSAMKYIFNIEKIGYLRYKLRSISSLNSRYSYILFIYLESNRKMHKGLKWRVSVEELKEILNCDKEESYKDFTRFNDRLLKRVHKEINEKTECKFSYKTVKTGRFVTGIEFKLESNAVAPEISYEKETFFDLADLISSVDNDSYIESEKDAVCSFLRRSLCLERITDEQVESLCSLVFQVQEDKLPQRVIGDRRRIKYIIHKVFKMKDYEKKKQIDNEYNYLCKMIWKDIKS